jgi:sugar lactone lactonase YvrE
MECQRTTGWVPVAATVRSCSARLFCISLFLFASHLGAQVPKSILIAHFRSFEQTSATNQQSTGAGFGAQVTFSSPPAASVSVQLRRPDGITHGLTRQADGSFDLELLFSDAAQLSGIPNGSYTVVVTGGSAPSTTTFSVNAGNSPDPVLITNFDALQAWPNLTPEVTWQPLSGVTRDDYFSLSIARTDGTVLFESETPASNGVFAITSMTSSRQLPMSVPLRGELDYIRLTTSTANSGNTILGVATGFEVSFPLMCIPLPPTFVIQPLSQVGHIGSTVVLETAASGFGNQSFQFQLKKNGIPVPGIAPQLSYGGSTSATYRIPIAQISDAGTYTVEVSYEGQVVVSNPATIVVASHLTLANFAGSGSYGAADGPPSTAQFENPMSLAIDTAGNIYVADQLAFVIRVASPTGVVRTLAGSAERRGAADGVGSAARFSDPTAVAVDSAGNVYVADSSNNTIRKITPAGAVSTMAGQAGAFGSTDGTGANARFHNPSGVAVDPAGNLYVSDLQNHTIRKITPEGVVTTLAGMAGVSGSGDGTGNAARFLSPLRSKFHAGNLYVGDQNGIRRVSPTGAVTTIVPVLIAGEGDKRPPVQDIAVDSSGAVYAIASRAVRRMTAGGVLATVAAGEFGGIVVDAQDNVFLSVPRSHVIRKGTLTAGGGDPGITVINSPRSHTVAAGASVLLSAQATGPDVSYQWLANGTPIPGATSSVLLAQNTTGSAVVSYSVAIGNAVGLASHPAPPAQVIFSATSDPGRIRNLSIRSNSGTDAQTLIVGLVLSGGAQDASTSFLIRGIGPGLTAFGVPNVLADPTITIANSSAVTVGSNDDWGGATQLKDAFASVGAFPLVPSSQDAALSASLTGGGHTVQVSGKNGATGIALAEVYDLTTGATAESGPRLINLSARTQVGTGSNILIAGFAVGGSTSKTLLIRGVGLTLSAFGVAGALADPLLQIFNGNTIIATSDNWSSGTEAEMGSVAAQVANTVGAFRLDSASDAALVVTLPPGSYTAQVSGVAGTSGVALVEIYEVP